MTDVQPDWSDAPPWAQWWAADSDGYAHWYRDQPTYDCEATRMIADPDFDGDNIVYGLWLRPWGTEDSEPSLDMQLDATWPPEEFDDWNIEWDKTLRRRP